MVTVATDSQIAVTSKALKTSDICSPTSGPISTSNGATISAIWALLPIEISSASVMSFFIAAEIAL
jgi:hypothetical protein